MNNFKFFQNKSDVNKWLTDMDVYLKNLGYNKYKQGLKREDFSYWKVFDDEYQVGVLIYDYRKMANLFSDLKVRVDIQYECMLLDDMGNIELSISKEIELSEFEKIAKEFNSMMKKHF